MEREREEKKSRRLRQRDFQDVMRETDLPLLLLLQGTGFVSRVQNKEKKKKTFAEERTRRKKKDKERDKERDVDIHPPFGSSGTKSGFEILRGRIMTDEIPY